MFEELLAAGHRGAEYDAWLINIMAGDQFSSGFVAINPNSKIPALLDRSGPKPVRLFESGAMLLHLAETFGAFLPTDPAKRTECLCWLFWQMGSAPYVGGGFGHFYAYAPFKIEYAIDRFAMETKRQLDVLDRRLAGNEYLAGDEYTIADIATWPWYSAIMSGAGYNAAEFLSTHEYKNVHALGGPDRRPPGGEARAHGQPDLRQSGGSASRAPRRRRFRDQDRGQASPGGMRLVRAPAGAGPLPLDPAPAR